MFTIGSSELNPRARCLRIAKVAPLCLLCTLAAAGCKSGTSAMIPTKSAAQTTAKNDELLRAAERGNGSRCGALVKEGADTAARGATGRTPLHLSAMNGHPKCSATLITDGANPFAQDDNGDTPLHLAAMAAHDNTIRILLSAGASKTATNKAGKSPADVANPIIKHLLQ